MKDEAALRIDDLGVRYADRWVLKNFSLRLNPREKVAIAGPSGSGKSTVLRCVLGLVAPMQGAIRIFGQPLDERSVWETRLKLAYVAQEPDLGSGTVRDAIARPFGYKVNAALKPNLQRVPELMDRFRLSTDLLDKEVSTLSGGEKQRFALVSAIVLDRPIVLLDEASSALDKANKRAVSEFFRQADDLTVLSVSHDAEWRDFCGRTIDMGDSAAGAGVRA